MTTATLHASAFAQSGFALGPIFAFSLVKMTSGNTAKESCKLRIT